MSLQKQEKRPDGLSTYLKRFETAFLTRPASKRPPSIADSTTTSNLPSNRPVPTLTSTAEPNPLSAEEPIDVDRIIAQRERARALLARYGLHLGPEEVNPSSDIQFPRVNRTIRIRVRRTCHRCETAFGPNTVCINCQHPRCKSCPISPVNNEHDDKCAYVSHAKVFELCARRPGTLPMTPHLKFTGNPAAPLTMQSRIGGPDHLRKPVVQRVRRMCHSCDTMFEPGSKECGSCAHVRCKKCPRSPHRPEKYPNGYPGDVEPPTRKPERTFRKPRQRVHCICHVCHATFNDGASTCGKCGQAKCAETVRNPPKKVKTEPDSTILRRVEDRITLLADIGT
ncbi:hypothetical protein N7539_003763 [Penicillium diatomitis]|uniref:Uncharacterized protein n=1 Tax=Penicillium diatomitis TaxID=2819901 RepID=A0A9W9XDI3_9EURO|nr:uncharacterized protein N7539_003763 [Penicillium diatomitis]KAJ5488873.1 hypothetical protein N7539_003763 [Penicillium diatomitis]